MLLDRGKYIFHSIPYKLPCGQEINANWDSTKEIECCRTVCDNKVDKDIEACHNYHKKKVRT